MNYKHVSVLFNSLVILTLILLWVLYGAEVYGVALCLLLAITAVVKYKYWDNVFIYLIEAGICCLSAVWFSEGLIGFAIPISALVNKRRFSLAALIAVIGGVTAYLRTGANIVVLVIIGIVYLFSAVFGFTLCLWKRDGEFYKKMADSERQTRLELEKSKAELLTLSKQAVTLAEHEERNRIARDIHDHVGHEITGALLAVQSAEKLYELNHSVKTVSATVISGAEDKISVVLSSAAERLQLASEHLRETVHNLKSTEDNGFYILRKLTGNYTFCETDFSAYGDFSDVSAAYWALLEAVLKEALTNTARHSNADRVSVRLDITERYLRMAVSDNGATGGKPIKRGMGLTNMRDRVTAQGGNFSVNNADGFMLTCNLPL